MPVAAWACSMFLAFSAICSASFDNTELLQTRADVSRERTRRSRAARDHDDFGNHMQMNPNISKTTFENHTQVHEGHQSFYANMDQTFLAMSANIDELEEGTSSDPDPQTTLANFKSMMENTIQVFMEAEHDQDQTEFDTKRTQHNSCSGAQRWQVGGDVANAAGELDKWQGKHQNCRKSEQAWDDYQAGISSCDSTSEVTQHEVSAAHTSLANLIVTARSTAETYANTDPAGKRACDLDQTEYEEHFCAWRAANYYACAASSDCTAHTGLNALRTSLLARASNRRNLWTTMEKMMCRVTYVMSSVDGDDSTEVSDFNETHSCENMAINASKFALDLEVPSTPECNDHAVASSTNSILAPSTVDGNTCTQFREAKYAWDEGQYAIPSVCFATCPVLTTYSTWEVPEDCINEPGECQFYNHHRDACGSYDTATFVAGDACCGCGGGALAIVPVGDEWVLPTFWNIVASTQYHDWGPQQLKSHTAVREGYNADCWIANEDSAPWVTFDAGQIVVLTGFATGLPYQANWVERSFKDFQFQKSEDGLNSWQQVLSGTATPMEAGDRQEFGFPASSSQHWRLLLTNNFVSSDPLRVDETRILSQRVVRYVEFHQRA